ncbi:MAG: ThuA domain-containing protein [Planctomycetes bacterium]|nr:ThuA domain-containing protein [Planctomycetota bacterium]
MPINVTVFGENIHERENPLVAEIYPIGMHGCIAAALNRDSELRANAVTQDQPEHGLTEQVLERTDVLTWWGHVGNGLVDDRIVERVHKRVLEGMGLIVLHSGHGSKIFKRLMGTGCDLTWRIADERERVWVCNPGHAIAQGIGATNFTIDREEMYGEPFGIPNPEEVVFLSWFQGGEVFRSGVTYRRGAGKIFYFRPGHETYPTYHHPIVQRVLTNAVHWARPEGRFPLGCAHVPVEQATERFVVDEVPAR